MPEAKVAEEADRAVVIQIPVPFETLMAIVRQLDGDRLEMLKTALDETLACRTKAPSAEDPAEAQHQAARARARKMLARSRENQESVSRAAHQLLKTLGIEDLEPIGAQQVRQMMLDEGIREEDNEFSREIIAMREE